jgi:ATP-dependent Clp protease adaptor protein ClpS
MVAAQSQTQTATRPEQHVRRVPPHRVVLHNDNVNTFEHVILTILKLTPIKEHEAIDKTIEAHETGHSVLLVTTKERAELYVEQFATFRLTVTAEPDE